jgi:hypothetical protein
MEGLGLFFRDRVDNIGYSLLYLVPVLVCTGDEMSFCFTGRQHLKEDVDRETVNERGHSISDMYNMFEYAKQAYRDSMPYGAMGAFFHDRTIAVHLEPLDRRDPRKQSQGLRRDLHVSI